MRAYLGLVATLVAGVASEQHILLDSTKESMLDWFKYPKGPQSPTPGEYPTRLWKFIVQLIYLTYPPFITGWVEESFTNFDKGINWRSYVVCDVGHPNVNNWLWTPFIERGEANRIYIEVNILIKNTEIAWYFEVVLKV